MTSPEQEPSATHAARRKLVRGAFAAPALLTVYSGSALATSSAKRCLTHQTNTPTMAPVKDGGSLDGYLRVKLKKTGSYPNVKYWIYGQDLQVWKCATTNVYLSGTNWQPFDIVNNNAGTKQDTAPTNYSDSNKYAAVRFDARGNVVGVGKGSGAESAIAGTCWQSVSPTL